MTGFRRICMGIALTSVIVHAAGPAWAQRTNWEDDLKPPPFFAGTPPQKLEPVVVTGVKGSTQRAHTLKRNAETHVDVVAAEDIAKMPDKNVADSLARIAGAATSSASATEGGFDERDRVGLRGLSPSLTQTLLNGHGLATGDWFVLSQTAAVGRSMSFSLLPSELVDRVVVHKTASASQLEGGVAGNVELVTPHPLAFKRRLTWDGLIGAVYSDLPARTGHEASALLNWRNAGQTVGVLLHMFSESRHLRRDGVEVLGYDTIAAGSAIAQAHPDLSGVSYPKSIGVALFEQKREREGAMIELEMRPRPGITYSMSLLHSGLAAGNYNRTYLLNLARVLEQGRGQSPLPGYVIRDGTLQEARFNGEDPRSYGSYDQVYRPGARSSVSSYAFDSAFELIHHTELRISAGSSSGHGRTPRQYTAEWDTGFVAGGGYRLDGVRSAPSFDLGATDNGSLSSVHGLAWMFGTENVDVRDVERWAQLDLTREFDGSMLTSLQYGLRAVHHARTLENVTNLSPRLDTAFEPTNWPTTTSNFPADFGDRLGGTFPQQVWYYDAAVLRAFSEAHGFRPADPQRRRDYLQEYAVKERALAAYAQLNFEWRRLTGNVGLRMVQAQESVTNYVLGTPDPAGAVVTSELGVFQRTQAVHTYTDALPSLNLRYSLGADAAVRFAVARTIARPDYSSLAGAMALDPPHGSERIGTGTGGNPDLQPIRGRNADLSIEWYPGKRSLVTAGVFVIDLPSYVSFANVLRTFGAPGGTTQVGYLVTQPINVRARVAGAEIAADLPLGEQIGASLAYANVTGREDTGAPMLGTSRHSGSASAWYEAGPLSLRATYAYRSHFYNGIDRSTSFFQDGSGNLSVSALCRIDERTRLQIDVQNLNDPVLRYYAASREQPRAMYRNGRQLYVALKASY